MRKKSGGQKQTAESTVPAAMWSGTQLPQELVLDILYRLPPKSICRFKCVSKLWLTLISDPNFAKTQLNRNNNNNNKRERLILISDYLYSVDCAEASNNNDAVIATKVLDLLPIECPEEFEILGSCNGLLLVSDVDSNKFLLNPSIREIRTLDESPFAYNSVCGHTTYGLGYDSSTDDYKVVAIEARDDAEYDDCDESCCTYTTVSVYSLKTDSWTRIQDVPHYHSYIMISSLVHLNGSIHWLTFGSYGYSFVIAAFDLVDEKFRELQTPRSLDTNNFNLVFCKFEVFRGCLCMLVPQNGTQTDVWVMKEYGVTESWTKCTMFEPNLYMMEPLFFLEDEEVALERDGQRLVAFNAKEKTSRDIVVHGIPAMFKAGKTYVESLVSPYHVCGIDCVFESMIEAFGAGREQSVAKAKRSRSIEASNSIADRLFSDFLDCLKSTWTLETPIYEKALKMLKEPYWRERFISMLDERKRANRTGLEVECEETKNWVQLTNCSTHTDQGEMVSLSQGAGSESGPIPRNEAFHCVIGTKIGYELDLGYGAKPTQSTSSNCAEVEAANKRANKAEERARNAERMASEALEKLKEMEEFRTNMEQQIRAFNNCMAGQSLDLDIED